MMKRKTRRRILLHKRFYSLVCGVEKKSLSTIGTTINVLWMIHVFTIFIKVVGTGERPTTLEYSSHPHPLTLRKPDFRWFCSYCQTYHESAKVCYRCPSNICGFNICMKSAVGLDIRRIYHPSHRHPLVSPLSTPILCKCKACGIEHKGVFFLCTMCADFAIHTDCIKLPKSLLIQTTNDNFHHTHPLTLSYSFPMEDQITKYYPSCRVCGANLSYSEELWIYKCEKCIYYIHVRCAKSKQKPLVFIKNFVDADYPHLLHLPFPDETYSISRHLFSKETRTPTDEVSITHQHDLVLVDTEYIDRLGGPTSPKINPLIMCHNPMKKIQLLCNGCLRPITEMPFYKCGANEDESCNFVIHEWCTRQPTKVDNHPFHPQHTLVLMLNIPHAFFNIFKGDVCDLDCNGYAYGCPKCEYYVDVSCSFIPEKITHKSHPNHLLSIVEKDRAGSVICLICHRRYYLKQEHGFSCNICDVYMHLNCAMMLPETIWHPYDKHPMHLSYLPIENHKSEYFCEICEYNLNPHNGFYHCVECAQSVHSACAPLILCCETETYSLRWDPVYMFINVKFGGTHKIDSHAHLLTFAQGIESDGQCNICGRRLQLRMIFKCAECEFAIHYNCCKDLSSS
ncbi:uncharacterized protein LOC143581336 [Bidens hawaiensis]|uniref:uncharacterized protein LOC143581336 n=1 Tax=Bidens hawaiensis TaxID=980011 RepID=UPI0040494C04